MVLNMQIVSKVSVIKHRKPYQCEEKSVEDSIFVKRAIATDEHHDNVETINYTTEMPKE